MARAQVAGRGSDERQLTLEIERGHRGVLEDRRAGALRLGSERLDARVGIEHPALRQEHALGIRREGE
jgi:hypothetical protein